MGARPALLLALSLLASSAAAFMFVYAVLGMRRMRLAGRGAGSAGTRQEASQLHGALAGLGQRALRVGAVRRLWENTVQRRRREALRACTPEALRLLGTSLEAGGSLVQALRYAAENCAEPLSSELMRTVWDLDAGRSFDEAMQALRRRTGGSEFAYLAVAMEIQHKSGGSLGEVLSSVAGSLRQAAKLSELLKTKTAQGRLSARIVTVMPVALLAVLSLFSADYVARFFESAFGVVLLVFALVLELGGILLVRKTLSIDLSYGGEGGAGR